MAAYRAGTPSTRRCAPGPDAAAIEAEVWELPETGLGGFVAEVPPPLAIGTVRLADGTDVAGFVCEPEGPAGGRGHLPPRGAGALSSHPERNAGTAVRGTSGSAGTLEG